MKVWTIFSYVKKKLFILSIYRAWRLNWALQTGRPRLDDTTGGCTAGEESCTRPKTSRDDGDRVVSSASCSAPPQVQ